MIKIKKIIINENDSKKRLDSFLQKVLKGMPLPLIYKYIRKGRIKLNEKKACISSRLCEKDVLSLYINDEFFEPPSYINDFKKVSCNINIIYEDGNLMIINKPPGIIVHPDKNSGADCLINRIKNYLYTKKEYIPENENSFTPALVNRIDRNTSGMVIAAKNAQTLAILNQKMKMREIHKSYICIVCGKMDKKSDTLTAYLEKNENQNKVYIKERPLKKDGLKTIITQYKVLKETQEHSLLNVDLLTGRTHQIRAHLAFIGHPILGDGKYGKNSLNKLAGYKYQALCSYKIKFDFKFESGALDYLNGKEFKIPLEKIWFVEDFNINLNLKIKETRKHSHKKSVNKRR